MASFDVDDILAEVAHEPASATTGGDLFTVDEILSQTPESDENLSSSRKQSHSDDSHAETVDFRHTDRSALSTSEVAQASVLRAEPLSKLFASLEHAHSRFGQGASPVTCLCVHAKMIAAGTAHGSVLLFDHFESLSASLGGAACSDPKQKRSTSTTAVTALAMTPRGDRILVAHQDGSLVLWDIAQKSPLKKLQLAQSAVSFLRVVSSEDKSLQYLFCDSTGTFGRGTLSKVLFAWTSDTQRILDGNAGVLHCCDTLELPSCAAATSSAATVIVALAGEEQCFLLALVYHANSRVETHILCRLPLPKAPTKVAPSVSLVARHVSKDKAEVYLLCSNTTMSLIGITLQLQPLKVASEPPVRQLRQYVPGDHTDHPGDLTSDYASDPSGGVLTCRFLQNSLVVALVARNDSTELVLLDTELRELQQKNLSALQPLLMSRHTQVPAAHQAIAIADRQEHFMVIGAGGLWRLKLLSWSDRVDTLILRGDWLDALSYILALYDESEHMVALGLPHKRDKRRHCLKARADAVTAEYFRLCWSQQWSLAQVTARRELNNSDNESEVRRRAATVLLRRSDFHALASVVAECAVRVDSVDAVLCHNVFTLVNDTLGEHSEEARRVRGFLLAPLEKDVLKNRIRSLPPSVMQDLVSHFSDNTDTLRRLEQMLMRLDASSFDLHMISTALTQHHLFDALAHIAFVLTGDCVTPANAMLDASAVREDALAKLLEFLAQCFRRGASSRVTETSVRALLRWLLGAPLTELLLRDHVRLLGVLKDAALRIDRDVAPPEFALALLQHMPSDPADDRIPENEQSRIRTIRRETLRFVVQNLPSDIDSAEVDTEALEQVLQRALSPALDALLDVRANFATVDRPWTSEEREQREKNETLLVQLHARLRSLEPLLTEKTRCLIDSLMDSEILLERAHTVQFFRLQLTLYRLLERHDRVVECFLSDPALREGVFDYIRRVLDENEHRPTVLAMVRKVVLKRLADLIELDASAVTNITLNSLQQSPREVSAALSPFPSLQLAFLRHIFIKVDKRDDDETERGGSVDFDQVSVDSSTEEHMQDAILQAQFISLLCRLAPHDVKEYLHDALSGQFPAMPVSDMLQEVRKHGVRDAEAFLLERMGDISGAMQVLLTAFDEAPDEYFEDCLSLCARQNRRGDIDSEALWFALLNRVALLPAAPGTAQEERKEALLQTLLRRTTEHVDLDALMSHLSTDRELTHSGNSALVRMLRSLLQAYAYQHEVLRVAVRMQATDLAKAMRNMVNSRARGHLMTCAHNHRSSDADDDSRNNDNSESEDQAHRRRLQQCHRVLRRAQRRLRFLEGARALPFDQGDDKSVLRPMQALQLPRRSRG
ncbi:MAG: hypothetical protein MHM6MM_003165 [Cercozoa sp. M6MM]